MFRNWFWIGILLFLNSCASFYKTNQQFNRAIESGDISQAQKVLLSNEKAANSKSRFLYYANLGVVQSMLGNFGESNKNLEKAYIYGEDYQKNYFNLAASYFTNASMLDYPGENHEHLMVLYYKALNYLKMQSYDSALVECRRLNIRLQELSSKYKSENKYKEDAFIHNLMGIIYEADKDFNNAFIAYRNAYNIYREQYLPMFGLDVPEQLKHDLLRTASIMGFESELAKYEEKFGEKYDPLQNHTGQLVFFWHNGLGPVKSENSLNFAVLRGEGGLFTFKNDENNMSFPFNLGGDENEDERKKLNDLEFFRIAFPKYLERPLVFQNAQLEVNGNAYPLFKAEDINAIAFKSLRERMLQEFSKSLLRVALKKATEYAARDKSDDLGTAISLINFITEKADTRNWQTLPHGIYYSRVFLPEGKNQVKLQMKGNHGTEVQQFGFDIKRGETVIHSYHSLDAGRPLGREPLNMFQ
jgi:uncharacterized protein